VLTGDLEHKWEQMLVSIDTKLRQTKLRVGEELVKFYERAYECDPGCHCDNIMIEYDQVIEWQDDLSTRIVEYTTNLNGLILNEQQIIESCPAYIYDADGNAFFDYSGVSHEIVEHEEEIVGDDESTHAPVETTEEVLGGDETSHAPIETTEEEIVGDDESTHAPIETTEEEIVGDDESTHAPIETTEEEIVGDDESTHAPVETTEEVLGGDETSHAPIETTEEEIVGDDVSTQAPIDEGFTSE